MKSRVRDSCEQSRLFRKLPRSFGNGTLTTTTRFQNIAGASEKACCSYLSRNLLFRVLFSDESSFTNHGTVNWHNMRYWRVENLHWLREVEHQRSWSLNVGCEIIGNQLIGPYFIDGNLNSDKYRNFLGNELLSLIEDLRLKVRQNMQFQHDVCPAHYLAITWEVDHGPSVMNHPKQHRKLNCIKKRLCCLFDRIGKVWCFLSCFQGTKRLIRMSTVVRWTNWTQRSKKNCHNWWIVKV